ncbi:hypothetical protein CUJ83_02710 [Methanocella sp. CWC-04]|uniref:Carboxypeptidase regulatory-like domain-containing protein n=1 Tax=Methanooceanicella nereidis TaxID=2052831 RepID=A0AAP2W538_9EURY|nr:hypothetical protein [Methanocella sp. CWC-04]MCD1293908.1 hypothetical protein [Methanocella sp. CWC-04]
MSSIHIQPISHATNYTRLELYRISGRVIDGDGYTVRGADVLLESCVDRKMTSSSEGGRFELNIYVSGNNDMITIQAFFGLKSGCERMSARSIPGHLEIVIGESSIDDLCKKVGQ